MWIDQLIILNRKNQNISYWLKIISKTPVLEYNIRKAFKTFVHKISGKWPAKVLKFYRKRSPTSIFTQEGVKKVPPGR
jgi:hypothetical protein